MVARKPATEETKQQEGRARQPQGLRRRLCICSMFPAWMQSTLAVATRQTAFVWVKSQRRRYLFSYLTIGAKIRNTLHGRWPQTTENRRKTLNDTPVDQPGSGGGGGGSRGTPWTGCARSPRCGRLIDGMENGAGPPWAVWARSVAYPNWAIKRREFVLMCFQIVQIALFFAAPEVACFRWSWAPGGL